MLAASLIVLVIGQQAGDPSTRSFERALHGVLGSAAKIELRSMPQDPPDDVSVAQAAGSDGLVELVWAPDGSKARVHCYLVHEARWIDREITFGVGTASPEREASERGRLLGFAVGTMFTEEAALEPAPTTATAEATPQPPKSASQSALEPRSPPVLDAAKLRPSEPRRLLEFAGVASTGVHGAASGLGASAGLRLAWVGPLWARLFVSGRGGDIEVAQATTRTALLGGGLSLAALPSHDRFELGLRGDLFASYLEVSHLSEDDVTADWRSRWLPGGDLVAETGVHVAGGTGLFLAAGLEAMFGKTEVYTHGVRVAVVPPFRALGEFGFRARF